MAKPEVMSVGLSADYRLGAEVIESTWMWMLALGAVIATAAVSGLDRRRKTRSLAQTEIRRLPRLGLNTILVGRFR